MSNKPLEPFQKGMKSNILKYFLHAKAQWLYWKVSWVCWDHINNSYNTSQFLPSSFLHLFWFHVSQITNYFTHQSLSFSFYYKSISFFKYLFHLLLNNQCSTPLVTLVKTIHQEQAKTQSSLCIFFLGTLEIEVHSSTMMCPLMSSLSHTIFNL